VGEGRGDKGGDRFTKRGGGEGEWQVSNPKLLQYTLHHVVTVTILISFFILVLLYFIKVGS
jgi:hypothetical protein